MTETKSSCIICHKPIEFDTAEVETDPILTDRFIGCPNKHLAHIDCIKDWMLTSMSCPVCSELFHIKIVNFFADYKAKVEEEKRQIELQKMEEEKRQKELAERWDPEFEKCFGEALNLEESQDYTNAIKKLWNLHDKYAPNPKMNGHKDLLLELGRCYLLNKQYALANNQLMKLIKIDFNFPLAFYYLGLSYEYMNMKEKAIWAYERALLNTEQLCQKCADYYEILEDVKNKIKVLKA